MYSYIYYIPISFKLHLLGIKNTIWVYSHLKSKYFQYPNTAWSHRFWIIEVNDI